LSLQGSREGKRETYWKGGAEVALLDLAVDAVDRGAMKAAFSAADEELAFQAAAVEKSDGLEALGRTPGWRRRSIRAIVDTWKDTVVSSAEKEMDASARVRVILGAVAWFCRWAPCEQTKLLGALYVKQTKYGANREGLICN
jgi:hypothetical protein